MNSNNRDEEWLEQLLSQPPELKDNDFTTATCRHIASTKRKRRMVFVSVWVIATSIMLVTSPSLLDWAITAFQTETAQMDSLVERFSLNSRQSLTEQLLDSWKVVVAVLIIFGAFLKDLVFAD